MDSMVLEAIERIRADEEARKHIHGPSEVRDKFTSSYWRRWNKDKKILDGVSLAKIRRDLNDSGKIIARKRNTDLEKRFEYSTFGNEKRKTFFDHHLLGDTNVKYLVEKGMRKKLASVDSIEYLKSYKSDIESNDRGIVFGNSSRLAKENTLTATCEFYPGESAISLHKGPSFGTGSRFRK